MIKGDITIVSVSSLTFKSKMELNGTIVRLLSIIAFINYCFYFRYLDYIHVKIFNIHLCLNIIDQTILIYLIMIYMILKMYTYNEGGDLMDAEQFIK